MGYSVYVNETNFMIKKENQEKAFNACKKQLIDADLYSWVKQYDLDKADHISHYFEAFGWDYETDSEYNIIDVEMENEKIGIDLLNQLYNERKEYKMNITSQNFWTTGSHKVTTINPKIGDKVREKGKTQIMEVTFVDQGIAVCKWFDMHGYEMVDTFDLGDLEFANTQVSTLDDHDCTESKKKGWCGEYCEQARKGKCPEGIKAKFPYDDKEEAEKEEIKDFEYDGTWTTL